MQIRTVVLGCDYSLLVGTGKKNLVKNEINSYRLVYLISLFISNSTFSIPWHVL